MTESEIRDEAIRELSRWFRVHREVQGKHPTGKKMRLDAVFVPADPTGWGDSEPAFGVEFKAVPDGPLKGDYARWLAQSIDYTSTEWAGFGLLKIFMCPSPFPAIETLYGGQAHDLICRIAGQLGVGDLGQRSHYGWTLSLHGNHRLWSETYGVEQARKWGLRPKRGSR